MPALTKSIRGGDDVTKVSSSSKKIKSPVWTGPSGDGPNGGITFSALSRYLCCPERFRLLMVEGLRAAESFNHRMFYGNAWHVCEQSHAAGPQSREPDWQHALADYCGQQCREYPLHQQQIQHWYEVCRVQFPLYVKHWKNQPDVRDRTPLLQEKTFDVPYTLPSGRTVRLRGKWDSVDLVGRGKQAVIVLQENKTKSDIDEREVKRQMAFDLQTMMYLVALNHYDWTEGRGPFDGKFNVFSKIPLPVKGVRYNVVRRPLSGGKGSIKRHKPTKARPMGETKEHFYGRLSDIIKSQPDTFFMRWDVTVTDGDVKRFRRECLDPVLENLCDDWEWWEWWQWCYTGAGGTEGSSTWDGEHRHKRFPAHCHHHFRFPYGCWNPLTEGFDSDLCEYLASGSTAGLKRVDRLFTELT